MTSQFYVGDVWDIEITVTNTKTGLPGEPGEVKVVVYSPAARTSPPTVEPVTLTAAKTGVGIYEVSGIELTESGQWLAVVDTTTPYQGTQPVPISVANPV